MIIAAIVLAVLAGDLVLAVGFGHLLRRAAGRCRPAVDLDNNWSKSHPQAVRARVTA
ncbi:hypothetical protein [uncultured Jatrophihabitans sp.]|uniref:hypothetical protein n=1 Tax=uncultured Jatrophihabitans sp. TaxID=1610747 RepID=UPI0035CA11CD